MPDAPPAVVSALQEAVAAVTAAKVPKDLRQEAFKAALAEVGFGAQGSTKSRPSKGTSEDHAQTPDRSRSSNSMAQALDLDPAIVEQVYEVEDGQVHLLIKRSSLDNTKKNAQQELAYLVLAGNRAAGLDDWVPLKLIADMAQDLGVHDSNFSKRINAIKGDGIRVQGPNAKRELKINKAGLEKAAQIISRITETSA